jgi:hypothetical protein
MSEFDKMAIEQMMSDVVIRFSCADEETASKLYDGLCSQVLDNGRIEFVLNRGQVNGSGL